MGHKTVIFGLLFSLIAICCVGCSDDILDPSTVGRWKPIPKVNVILNNLGVVEEPADTFDKAEDPLPEDVLAADTDYVFGAGDVVRIYIHELYEEGVPFVNDYIVTETGIISIPDIGTLKAVGRTETQFEESVRDILSPDILRSPSVKVTLMDSQRLIFSISGKGVLRGSRYQIPRYDLRLMDALALAGGIEQFNVSNIYITRQVKGDSDLDADPVEMLMDKPSNGKNGTIEHDSEAIPEEEGLFELIAPSFSKASTNSNYSTITASEMATKEELEAIADQPKKGDSPLLAKSAELASELDDSTEEIEWVFKDGKYVPVPVKGSKEPELTEPTLRSLAKNNNDDSYGWDDIGVGGTQSRLIKVPVDKLYGGDPKYNIVIKPGDAITVPVDSIGEFYVMGHFNHSGPLNLTGRKMTLMRAVSAAGGLGELAWPKKVEITRLIGKDKQVTVLVDLEKIAKGTQPDIFIKPDDLINVGTHGSSRYLYVLRNAFNASYGAHLSLSRNFIYENRTARYNYR